MASMVLTTISFLTLKLLEFLMDLHKIMNYVLTLFEFSKTLKIYFASNV